MYTKENLRIVFMGTPEIAATVLEGMIQNNFNIVGLVAQPDRPVGRKRELKPVPTKVIAEKFNIPCYQPVKLGQDFEFLKELNPDVVVTIAYGQIVPQKVLDVPTLGCINLHGSLLPKYRGAAPIQYAIKNGEKKSGMTLMRMVKAMDAGEMYAVKEIDILPDDNSTSLFYKMGLLAKDLIIEKLIPFANGELQGIKQDESLVSFAPSIKPEEEKINLNQTSEEIVNQIRALSDEPGAYLLLNNEKLKIYKARKVSDKGRKPGLIIQADKTGLLMECSDGTISLLEVQKQGKSRMSYKDFVNGNRDLLNAKLI